MHGDLCILVSPAFLLMYDLLQVFFDPTPLGISFQELVTKASELPEPIRLGGSRLVVHIQTSPEAVEDLIGLIRTLAEEKANAGFVPTEPTDGSAAQNIYVRGVKAEKKE